MERAAQQLYQAELTGGNRMASSESEAVRRKDRILIAVRDDTLAGVIKELIEQNHGQADVTAASAAEVRPLLAERRFHLVILDGDLPGGEGFALLGEARTLAATARVPVIVLVSSEADMVRALEGGANDYIVKPFQPMALLASVRRVLSRGIFSAVTTILVVDDDLPELILVGTALHKAGGFKVLMQRSGQGALRRMLELHPQAVIWRWNLPELGGGELLKTLSNTVGFEKLGVLFLADARQTGMIPVSDDPRVKGVVTYPVDVLSLAARVRTLLKVAPPGPDAPRADEAHWQREIQGLFQSPTAAKVA